MEQSVQTISSKLPSDALHFEIHVAQLGHFKNKVIYARVQEDNDGIHYLTAIWESLRDGCRTAGIVLIDSDRFTPHITLLKLSKDPTLYRKVNEKILETSNRLNSTLILYRLIYLQGIKAVAPHLYESHVERQFGRQVVVMKNQLLVSRIYSRSICCLFYTISRIPGD